MESISLDVMDFEPAGTSSIKIMDDFPSSSSSSVPGLDFLMNKNAVGGSKNKNTNFDLGDLDSFENEMKSLSGVTTNAGTSGTNGSQASAQAPASGANASTGILSGISSLFGGNNNNETSANLGQRTKEETGSKNGFIKFTEIPEEKVVKPHLSEREKNKRKKTMLSSLNEWKQKGLIESSVHYSNDMSYEDIEDEYEFLIENKKKTEAKKLYSQWFLTAVNTLEYANAALNPFDINLDGWAEEVSDDINSYDEIFGKLYDKYRGGELSPELSLVMKLGMSAAVASFTKNICHQLLLGLMTLFVKVQSWLKHLKMPLQMQWHNKILDFHMQIIW